MATRDQPLLQEPHKLDYLMYISGYRLEHSIRESSTAEKNSRRVKELPHVDVHYKNPVRGIDKRRYPLGENLYE